MKYYAIQSDLIGKNNKLEARKIIGNYHGFDKCVCCGTTDNLYDIFYNVSDFISVNHMTHCKDCAMKIFNLREVTNCE